MQRVVAVAEDGVPPVDLLHHLQVQAVLLQTGGDSLSVVTWPPSGRGGACFLTLMSWMSCCVGVSMGALPSMTFWMALAQRAASFSSLQ